MFTQRTALSLRTSTRLSTSFTAQLTRNTQRTLYTSTSRFNMQASKHAYEHEGTLNVFDEIKVDHRNVEDLFARFKQASANKDIELSTHIANTLIREAAIHSDAEEVSIYKTLEEHGMKAAAEHDREEHQGVKRAMATADNLVIKANFKLSDAGLADLSKAIHEGVEMFLSHAKEEEESQWPELEKKMSKEDCDALARSFLKSRTMVPTRPHPGAPQSGGMAQQAAGMASKPMDEAVSKMRKYVEIKYMHPAQENKIALPEKVSL